MNRRQKERERLRKRQSAAARNSASPVVQNSVVGKVAGNEKGPTRSQEPQLVGFALGYPPTDPRSLEPQDDQSQHSAVINLDSSSNSSNSNSSSSVDAVKTSGGARDGAVLTNSRAEVKKTSELRALTEPVAVMEGTNLRGSGRGDAGSNQPAEAGRKHKSSADSDTDSEEGAPVTKKPTKSRTFRRGLSKQKSLPTAEVPVAVDTEASLVYSTRVSQCMDAMRNGRIDVPKDLVDSGSENEEGGFITREVHVSPPKSAHDSSRKPEHSGNPEPSGVAPRLDDSLTYANRSPSPPPTPEELLPHKAPRLNKNVKNAIKILSSVEPQTSVSDLDVSIESIESPAPDRQVVVKCRSRSGIQRFHMQTSETFRRIFREMADHEGVKETQIVMFLREQSISSMDTPASIKLHVADIIDCRIGEENRNGVESSFVDEDSFVTIIIQGQNLRSKTTVKVRKDCPLRDGMEMYCNLQGVTMAAIRFQFDGDVISPDQTPHELEMEEDDCVDAIMLQ